MLVKCVFYDNFPSEEYYYIFSATYFIYPYGVVYFYYTEYVEYLPSFEVPWITNVPLYYCISP